MLSHKCFNLVLKKSPNLNYCVFGDAFHEGMKLNEFLRGLVTFVKTTSTFNILDNI